MKSANGARAFVAQRVLDFVLAPNSSAALGYVPDPAAVAITGHSRNGKQSLLAAAYDERFSAATHATLYVINLLAQQ